MFFSIVDSYRYREVNLCFNAIEFLFIQVFIYTTREIFAAMYVFHDIHVKARRDL